MSGDRVDINTADLQTLAGLPGIGETLAERIIAYREQERPFRTAEELAEVAGISVHMVHDIADRISVGGEVEAEVAGDEAAAPDTVSNGRPPVAPSDVSPTAGDETSDPVPGQAAEPVAESPAEAGPETATEAVDEAIEQPAMRIEAVELEPSPEPTTTAATRPTPRPGAPMEETPATTRVATQRRRSAEQGPAQAASRSPFLFWGYVLSAVAGGLMGAVLALFFLLLVNGTLSFVGQDAARTSEQRTTADLQALGAQQTQLETEVGVLNEQVEIARGQAATLTVQLATVSAAQTLAGEELAGLDETVTTLGEETARFAEEVEALAVAAENFERFLAGMRALLSSLEGTPEATATVAATATTTPGPTGSATPSVTPTAAATRTPRPSATPFGEGRATSTP